MELSFGNANLGKKKNYHNNLERKRRNDIKEAYLTLRDAIPCMYEAKVSRIRILKKGIAYIREQKEEISRCENQFQEMKEKLEVLKRTLDVIKTKDFSVRA